VATHLGLRSSQCVGEHAPKEFAVGGIGQSGHGHPFPAPTSWGYTQHAPFSAVYDHNKRSVYLMQQRLKKHPFLAMFDGPDANVSTEYRVRSYLHANCVHCHQPTGAGRSLWDARITTPRSLTGLIDGAVIHGSPSPEDRLIKPGSLEHSVLWQRLSQLNDRHMPPLATTVLNTQALVLLSTWITNELASYESFADWQNRHFAGAFAPEREANGDPDGDGVDNYLEYLLGTDPHRRSYGLKVSIERKDDRTLLRFPRLLNLTSALQFSDNPGDPNSWAPLDAPGNQPFFPAASGEAIIEDFSGNISTRFYRVIVREP
jgi:hypothetical protein